jgi:group II intron reverse transcriptase/maturase
MNWLNSTNAKEIGTLYLIFAVFAGMIGTAFSVLIRLELSAPGVQFLQGDHQLFNGAPSNCLVRCESVQSVFSWGQPNPENPMETPSLKAPTLASLGQLGGDNSMVGKPSERMLASYDSYGEDNESLQLSMLVSTPDSLASPSIGSLERYHCLGLLFYVKAGGLIWSNGQVAGSNPKERGHLKEITIGQCKNSGSPDGRKPWGDGGFVVARRMGSKGVSLSPSLVKGSRGISTKASLPAGFEKLGNLRELNSINTNHINTKVLDTMCDVDILIAAYTKLKSSPGNMTPGPDSETLDGIDRAWFDKLKKDLRTNAFHFRPARRLEIPKANGKGTRPLGIASPRDKIVQGAMLLVLEAIFEPSFTTHSHGFRPGRSCHTALGEIKRTFTSVNWFIEGDISKCFDTFDHKLLIHLISKRINDKGFIDLMHKALKAGYFFQSQYFSPDLGTPQGSLVSPILCNILLHGLDVFILELKKEFEVGSRRKINPLWRRLSRAGQINLVHENHISSRLHNDPGYKRLRYVRYADDFLIGVIGSKEDCLEIRDKIHSFLHDELKLNLNLDKTKITHARDSVAHFLGTDIRITPLDRRPLRLISRGAQTYRIRANTPPLLYAPTSKLVNKLVEKGFSKPGGIPTGCGRWIHFENHQIVKLFYQIWQGIKAYYSFADNFGKLGRVFYILKFSCARTLALKLKLGTAKKVFTKFGREVTIRDGDGKILASFPYKSLAKTRKFLKSEISNLNPMARLEKLANATFRTKDVLDKPCVICGATENIEMHHVRKLRDSSRAIKKDFLTSMMSRMNRKQVPICRPCHINYHKGLIQNVKWKEN